MGLTLLRNNYIEYDNEKEISSLFAKWTKDINSCRDFRVEAIAYYCGEWDERFGFWIHECSLEYGGLH